MYSWPNALSPKNHATCKPGNPCFHVLPCASMCFHVLPCASMCFHVLPCASKVVAALCVKIQHPPSNYVRHAVWAVFGSWLLVTLLAALVFFPKECPAWKLCEILCGFGSSVWASEWFFSWSPRRYHPLIQHARTSSLQENYQSACLGQGAFYVGETSSLYSEIELWKCLLPNDGVYTRHWVLNLVGGICVLWWFQFFQDLAIHQRAFGGCMAFLGCMAFGGCQTQPRDSSSCCFHCAPCEALTSCGLPGWWSIGSQLWLTGHPIPSPTLEPWKLRRRDLTNSRDISWYFKMNWHFLVHFFFTFYFVYHH